MTVILERMTMSIRRLSLPDPGSSAITAPSRPRPRAGRIGTGDRSWILTRKDQPRQSDCEKLHTSGAPRVSGWLKQHRHIPTRYGKRVANHLAVVALKHDDAGDYLTLRRYLNMDRLRFQMSVHGSALHGRLDAL